MRLASCVSRRAVLSLLPLAIPRPAPADEPLLADAEAIFTAGDARLLQPAFDDIKYLGVKQTACGRIDGLPAVKVSYNARKVSYKRVLGAFWRGIDPTRTAEQGQFGDPGPSIIWAANAEERDQAEGSRARLEASGLYKACTKSNRYEPSMSGVKETEGCTNAPLATEIRELRGEFEEDPGQTGWYLSQPKAYAKALQKSGRTAFFKKTYEPYDTTACKRQEDGGVVCGYVYFPCSDENGCKEVLLGTW